MKTKRHPHSIAGFLREVDKERRIDAKTLLVLMKEITRAKPAIWGTDIIGFGEYHYVYKSGREGDSFIVGFAMRKKAITIYIMPGYAFPRYKSLLKTLGSHKLGKSCLYIKSLESIDIDTLKKLIETGWNDMVKKYPASKVI